VRQRGYFYLVLFIRGQGITQRQGVGQTTPEGSGIQTFMQVKQEHGDTPGLALVFNQEEYDRLWVHYYEPVVVKHAELPGGTRLRRQTKPPRINGKSRGFKELRKHITVLKQRKNHREIFRLLCALRQWEIHPSCLGGAAHPGNALFANEDTSDDAPVVVPDTIDLTDDTVVTDVDTFICEVLLVNVLSSKVKLEDGQQKRMKLTHPITFATIKREIAPTVAGIAAAVAARAGAAAVTEVLNMYESGFTPSTAHTRVSEAKTSSEATFLVLNLGRNNIVSKGGGEFLTALLNARSLPLLVELDIASQSRSTAVNHAEFSQELSTGLKANQTLSKFTFSGDYITSKPATMETSMTEMDFSRKDLGVSGATLLSAFLPKCK
jgi:hypothetical protein